MNNIPIGELAAVIASFTWTIGSILFATISRRMGAFRVNAFRMVVAGLFVITAHLIFYGQPLPTATPSQWFYMSLSSLIGLVIGDFSYFLALSYIGARRGVLLISMAPVFTIISGYLILGEILSVGNYFGIMITMSGVWLVISEKEGQTGEEPLSLRQKTLGVIFGIIAAVGQGVGLVVSKLGMVGVTEEGGKPLETLPATMIRLIFAILFLWVWVVARKHTGSMKPFIKDKKLLMLVIVATFIGSFLGLWLSMVAVTYTKVGIASTLLSLMPVIVIPVLYLTVKQKTSMRSIIGASVTVVGVAILFLV